jgi:hypothetical protein
MLLINRFSQSLTEQFFLRDDCRISHHHVTTAQQQGTSSSLLWPFLDRWNVASW